MKKEDSFKPLQEQSSVLIQAKDEYKKIAGVKSGMHHSRETNSSKVNKLT